MGEASYSGYKVDQCEQLLQVLLALLVTSGLQLLLLATLLASQLSVREASVWKTRRLCSRKYLR
jgi:hypothetical protein